MMCLLVIRAPATNLARSSLAELDKVCDLFEVAASTSQIACNNLVRASHRLTFRLFSNLPLGGSEEAAQTGP